MNIDCDFCMETAKTNVGSNIRRIISKLAKQHPDPFTELNFKNPFELLVATILSAQCTDKRVNMVTVKLFASYPSPRELAVARTDELENQIKSTGFFRSKTRSLTKMAAAIVEDHGGVVPNQMTKLLTLPGVGRKTANVVLGHALGVPGLVVDRHVLRIANRLEIARGTNPESIERQLCQVLPKKSWTKASDILILHGRRVCKPKPLCVQCCVASDCPAAVQSAERTRNTRQRSARRSTQTK